MSYDCKDPADRLFLDLLSNDRPGMLGEEIRKWIGEYKAVLEAMKRRQGPELKGRAGTGWMRYCMANRRW